MHLRLISCEMFHREVELVASRSINRVEIDLLPKALHQLTRHEIQRGLQSLIDASDRPEFHAVLLACGTCQQTLTGLRARSVPLVLPRTRDCLSLLMDASKPPEKSRPIQTLLHARSHAKSSATMPDRCQPARKHGFWVVPVRPESAPSALNPELARGSWDWRKRFGRQEHNSCRHAPARPACPSRRLTRAPARLERLEPARAHLSLLQMLVDGYWSYDRFLVIPAGWRVAAAHGGIGAEEVCS